MADGGTMMSGVAGRYATALFELAEDSGATDAVAADLDRFDALMAESPDLRRLIKSPTFSADEQLRAIGAVLDQAGIDGLAAKFIRLVATKRRLFALPEMGRTFRAMRDTKNGVVAAQVTVAEPMSPAIEADIRAALRGVAGPKVALDIIVNPDIIGGMVVKLGSRMIDASLKTKLNALRLVMKEVG